MCDVHSPVYRREARKASLVHHCDECGRPIMRGEQYVSTFGIWDGDATTYRAHMLCDMLAEKVSRDDDCRMLGELRWGVEWYRAPPHLRRWGESILGVSFFYEEE